MKALYAAVIVILLQQLDSAVIVPRIVGNSVKMHPVLVIMSIYVFGRLFGLWGMFFAVPSAGVIVLLLKKLYSYKKRKKSKIIYKEP